MKLIKEYINERFVEESDPIKDMKIGTREVIKMWLREYDIINYRINDDLSIDCYQNVRLVRRNLHNFPDYIQFDRVFGVFNIQHNFFTTLRGCPKMVSGLFSCSNNLLTSLKYAPKEAMHFYCHHNRKKFTKKEVLKYCKVRDLIEV